MTVMKKGNQLVTDLYVKPTDKHQCLHAASCHASRCKKSIPLAKPCVLTQFVLKTPFLINDVRIRGMSERKRLQWQVGKGTNS